MRIRLLRGESHRFPPAPHVREGALPTLRPPVGRRNNHYTDATATGNATFRKRPLASGRFWPAVTIRCRTRELTFGRRRLAGLSPNTTLAHSYEPST